MSEVLASLKKIGGNGEQYTETVLWTNSAPTSSFSAQAVTLSQGMADFKYLKIKVAPSTTSTSGQYFEDIILVSELQRTQSSAQEGVRDRLVLGLARTTYDFERSYYYASNTSIYFMVGAQAGASTTNNSRIIPLEILGINELAHGTYGKQFYYPPALPTVNSPISIGFKPSKMQVSLVTTYSNSLIRLMIYDADVSETQFRWITNQAEITTPTYYNVGTDVGVGTWNFTNDGTAIVFTNIGTQLKAVTIMATEVKES